MTKNYGQSVGGTLSGAAVVLLSAVTAFGGQPPAAAVLGGDLLPPGQVRVSETLIGPAEIAPIDPIQRPSEYWLGLGCLTVQGALREQLVLPEGEGLLIEQIVPDSPAAAADLQQHDILLKADGRPVGSLEDLIDAVDAAQDKQMTLELLRGGKSKTIQVKPEKRPPSAPPMPGGPADLQSGRVFNWFERERPGSAGRPPWRFRFFNPGVILPPVPPAGGPMPGNLSVTIKMQGGQPAQIEVHRDDEQWEVDENHLDKLPADVRVHVQRMLSGVRVDVLRVGGGVVPEARVEGPLGGFAWPRIPEILPNGPDGRLEKRLEEMNRRIDEIRKSIEQLPQRRPEEKKPDKDVPQQKQTEI